MLKIASWNVNSLRVRLPHVLDWLAQQQPDILALQETKLTDKQFPVEAIQDVGYQALFAGQKTYNGVALLSKTSAQTQDIITDFPHFTDPQRRILGATYGDMRVLNLYVPNGSELGSEKYDYKLNWLAALQTYLRESLPRYPRTIVLGDFNIAPTDADVHDPAKWADSILVSPPERAALQALLDLGLHDTFRQFAQPEATFSWWDYRAAGFRRNHGLRIDLILASDALAPHCQSCTIDVEPRRLERPSDHAPVVAELIV